MIADAYKLVVTQINQRKNYDGHEETIPKKIL